MNRKWLHELPYLLIALYATKIGQAWRLAEGMDAAHKLLSLMDSLSASFASPLPSFELHDLCIGLLLGACFRLFIFIKDSEKKKYRKGREYGSARCPASHFYIIHVIIRILVSIIVLQQNRQHIIRRGQWLVIFFRKQHFRIHFI